MILFKVCLAVCLVVPTLAVINKNEKREAPFEKYGPPPVPHRTYGVPQQLPFREYGPPPSKLNFGSSYGGGFKHNNFHEQIIKVIGGQKPGFGPPHHKPAQVYGPPQHVPFTKYGPPPHKPSKVYGPPAKIYGPPPKPHFGKPLINYGPPKPAPVYGPPPQPLPHYKPAPLFKPAGTPHQNYGPPPVPHTNYGPPPSQPAPVYEPPSTSYGVPETTIIVTGNHQGGGVESLPVVESQSTHFGHAGCDGWKPIAAPVGHYVEHNAITETTGYSNVAVNGGTDVITSSISSEQSVPSGPGFTDEQLVAIALQSSQNGGNIQYTAGQTGSGTVFASGAGADFSQQPQIQIQHQPEIVHQQLPEPIPPQNFHVQQQLNIATASLVSTDDSYSRPPPDSYAPNSIHAQKYEQHHQAQVVVPSNQYGPPQPSLNQPFENYGPPPAPQPSQEYGPPKVSGNAYSNVHTETFTQSLPLSQPQQPLSFRPPVPAGLIENIGASVEHADNFGIQQQQQPPLNTYIPPHINEYPQPQQQQVIIQEQSFGHQQQQLQQQQYFENQQHQHFEQQYQTQQYQPDIQSINTHNCGHGPNLAGGNYQIGPQQLTGYNNIVTGGYSIGEQQQQQQFIQQPATSYGPPPSGSAIEQQQVLIQRPADSYGPPPSGQVLDASGYESKQSSVIASLPGLDGLNVLSAHKSEGVQLSSDDIHQGSASQKFEIRTEINNTNNTDDLISEGLIQKILSAVEENPKKDAQNRSDDDVDDKEQVESSSEKADSSEKKKEE